MLQVIELVRSLVQSTFQPFDFFRDSVDTRVANDIPIDQRSVSNLGKEKY